MKIRKAWRTCYETIIRPPLDYLGASVIGMSMGRAYLLIAIAASLIAANSYMLALMVTAALAVDIATNFSVLVSLRRLMQYEIVAELATPNHKETP